MKSFRTLLVCAALLTPGLAQAADVTVMISGGFKSSYEALIPAFEAATGGTVKTLPGPSMGTTADAIPVRLARGEPDDVLIMVGSALDGLIEDGKAKAGSKVDLALSPIGMVVKEGAPVPDISTVDKLKAVLLAAKSVAYSDSASGVYIRDELFKKLASRPDEGQGPDDPRDPRRRDRRQGGSRDRFPAGCGAAAGQGHRLCGQDPGHGAEGDGVLGRHRDRVEEPGDRQGTDTISSPRPRPMPVLRKMGLDPVKH